MKNICLNFFGLGINDKIQAYIKIIDKDCEVIYEGFTYNAKLSVCVEINYAYQLIAISNNEVINLRFYVNKYRDNYYFYFPRSIIKNRIITFQLTDSFYKNLPIEKGEIILWPK